MQARASAMTWRSRFGQSVIVVVLLVLAHMAPVQALEDDGPLMSPAAEYDLSWWTVDGGGSMFSTGGGYELGGTIGQPDVGLSTAGGYALTGGFWAGMVEGGETPPCAKYDLNQDGFVDLDDINLVIFNSIFVNEPYNPMYDLILDGIVDIADIFEVAVHFGESCP